MDKDLIKGLLMLLGFVVLLVVLFLAVSGSTQDKAECIANALKAKVPVANIDKMCRLTETRPTH